MVSSIYSLFKVDIRNLVLNKVHICRHWHIQPSEIERLSYWEYEMMMKEINDTMKKENKEQEEENGKYSTKGIERMSKNMTPKIPTVNMPPLPKL